MCWTVRPPIALAAPGRGAWVVGLSVGLLLLAVPPAWGTHVLGRYEGTLTTSGSVSFGVQVLAPPSPASVWGFSASPWPMGKTDLGQECRPSIPPTQDILPIVDHAFSDTTPPITLSGSFSAPLGASGTFRITAETWFPPAGQPPLGSTCDTGAVSWTASCARVTPADLCSTLVPDGGFPVLPPSGSAFPTFSRSAAGTKVSTSGRVTVPLTIGCPPPGSDCGVSVAATARVPASAAARRKQVKLGRSDYLVDVGGSAKTRFKLTGNARSLLRRLRRIKANVVINVTRGGSVVAQKTVTVRLKAPRRAP